MRKPNITDLSDKEYWEKERRRLRLKDRRSQAQKEFDFEQAMGRMF